MYLYLGREDAMPAQHSTLLIGLHHLLFREKLPRLYPTALLRKTIKDHKCILCALLRKDELTHYLPSSYIFKLFNTSQNTISTFFFLNIKILGFHAVVFVKTFPILQILINRTRSNKITNSTGRQIKMSYYK